MYTKLRYFVSLLLVSIVSVAFSSDTTKIIIMHTNDMHAKIEEFPKLSFEIEKIRTENPDALLVCAGDIFTGSPIVDKYKDPGFPIIELMNTMKYDVACLGNHEFDYGQTVLNARVKQAKFPILCANVTPLSNATLKPLDDFFKITTKSGISFGFVGLIQIGDNMLPSAHPSKMKNLKFVDGIELSENYKSYTDSADILIALTHLGIEGDSLLALKSPFFDLIIGGHSHTKIPNGTTINDVFVVQAGAYTEYLGVITISLVNKKIVSISDYLIDLNKTNNSDKKMKKIVNNFANNPFFYEVIGSTKTELKGNSELGALLTDAMIDATNADFAMQNIGGIRVDKINAGDITRKDILELSPFGNSFVIYELTPKQISELIAYAYSLYDNNEIQVSGLNVILKKKNNKLKKIILLDNNYKKLKNKKYKVVINDYMQSAYKLEFLNNPIRKTSIIDADATMNFISKKKIINYAGVERVKVNN